MAECIRCKAPLGDGPKRAPVFVDEGEPTCPRCFVWLRAPMEIGRFGAHHYAAVACSRCGWESVDVGTGRCAQCHSALVLLLPPPADGAKP
jgi:hypothetical protein